MYKMNYSNPFDLINLTYLDVTHLVFYGIVTFNYL